MQQTQDPAGRQPPLIEAVGLSKRFDDVAAVREISFTIARGEIFGFLGPNGAGKTTTINMLTGLSRPDAGTIRVAGLDCTRRPKAAQHLIGIVPDDSNLYPELTGFDNLCFCASLYGMAGAERRERAAQLLDSFGLKEAAGRKFAGYSKGMKRKLTIAAGIIHRPQILFLDEPTTGIDVASARQIRQLIAELNRSGTTIFLTTHYIEEAERLCQRIAFIVEGQIVRTDRVDDLLQPYTGRQLLLVSVGIDPASFSGEFAGRFPELTCERVSPQQFRVESAGPIRLNGIVGFLEERGIEVLEARRVVPTLEDVFVRETGIEGNILRREAEKRRRAA